MADCLRSLTVVFFFFFNPASLMGTMAFCCWQIFCVSIFGKDPNPDTARSVGVNAKERETREKNEEKGLRHGK